VTDRVQIAALSASIALLVLVLELVRRRRLSEEYSVLWIVSALALIGIAWRRDLLDTAAQWLGVYYPPALLLLAVILIMFTASLSFSVILSRHQRHIDRLIEETAVLSAEVRELREARGSTDHVTERSLARSSSVG
jgi:SNF family Na+-dependent transporter